MSVTASAPNKTPLCEFTGVSKWYGPVIGVNDVSLRLEGGITGLVGPNGAGKSTLIRLLTGQLRPSLGEARVCGLKAWSAAAKSHLGYCPDVDAFYEEMSGRAFVRSMARLHGFRPREARQRTDDALAEVGMSDRADRRLSTYSKGMRQRIKLAQALVHDPDLIVLDEPLNGVDPLGHAELINVFRSLAEQGKALLLSSHILDDMDTLADRILFICRGRILAQGSLQQIRDMLDDHPLQVRVTTDRPRDLAARLLTFDSVRGVELNSANDLILQVYGPHDFFAALADLAVAEHLEIERLAVVDQSTEAIFDYLMQRARHPA